MEVLSQALPIVIYFLLIILLVILITFGIKLLLVVVKLEKLAEDFRIKMESLNGIFRAVDFISNRLSRFGDIFTDFIGDKIKRFTNRRKKEVDEDE